MNESTTVVPTDAERSVARNLRGAYVALLDEGFTEDQATVLIKVLITRVLEQD